MAEAMFEKTMENVILSNGLASVMMKIKLCATDY